MDGYTYAQSHYGTDSGGNMDMAGIDGGISPYDFVGGQSLDDIVNQNAKELRRRSMPVHYNNSGMVMDRQDSRRMSMMYFKSMPGGAFDGFNFEGPETSSMDGIVRTGLPYPQPSSDSQTRRPSGSDIALNTQFPNQPTLYTSMPPPQSAYASPLQAGPPMDPELQNPYGPATGMPMPLDVNDTAMASMMNNDMNMYSQNQFASPMVTSPVSPDFAAGIRGISRESSNGTVQTNEQYGAGSGNGTPDVRSAMPSRTNSQEQGFLSDSRPASHPSSAQSSNNQVPTLSSFEPEAPRQLQTALQSNNGMKFPWRVPPGELRLKGGDSFR
jgi:hypothetical protein